MCNRDQKTIEDDVRNHYQEKYNRDIPVCESAILRNEKVKHTLGEQIMEQVPERKGFTGQVTVEVHLKDGQVKDVFMTKRSKLAG